MGIAGFTRWLLSSFPEAVRFQPARHAEFYDHVAFDLNQVIHQAARKSGSRPAFALALFRELDRILKNCVPRKSVFLAMDGPGPLAKLITQRKRRNKETPEYVRPPSSDDQAGKDSKQPSRVRSGKGRSASRAIDRLELTPGVDTLYFLNDAVEYWAYSRLQNDRKYRDVTVRISGADVAGEGELKLIDFCHSKDVGESDSVVVIGGDADIVLQGLATVTVRDFFVYLHKFDRSSRMPRHYVISVWELSRTFESLFPNESMSVRIDFILFTLLNGNDYIPKLRGVTMQRLWRRYLALKTMSTKAGGPPPFFGHSIIDAERRTFNWPFFHALIDRVGSPVPTIAEEVRKRELLAAELLRERQVQADAEGAIPQNGADSGPNVVETGYDNSADADGLSDGSDGPSNQISGSVPAVFNSGSPMNIDNFDDDDDEIIDPERNHIEGLVALTGDARRYYDVERWCRALLWTLQMYIDGYCSDFAFQYGLPYAPSCEALSAFIRERDGDPFDMHSPVSDAIPLRPHQVAAALLPAHAIGLLPAPLARVLSDRDVRARIFLAGGDVDIGELLRAVDGVPITTYTADERRRTVFGMPLLLRLARAHDRVPKVNDAIRKPVARFEDIRPMPVLFRRRYAATEEPPCRAWPSGSVHRMLETPYKRVGFTMHANRRNAQQPSSAEQPSKAEQPGRVGQPSTAGNINRAERTADTGANAASRAQGKQAPTSGGGGVRSLSPGAGRRRRPRRTRSPRGLNRPKDT